MKPTPDEQLAQWVKGVARCPNTRDECCPDFGCCRPKLLWPEDKRRRFMAADAATREKMMIGALANLVEDAGLNAYVAGRHGK